MNVTPTMHRVLTMVANGERGGRLTGHLKTAMERCMDDRLIRRRWTDDVPILVLTRKGESARVTDG